MKWTYFRTEQGNLIAECTELKLVVQGKNLDEIREDIQELLGMRNIVFVPISHPRCDER